MKRIVVAVFDSAVQAYNQPAFVPAIGAALRSFIDEVNRADPNNALNQHPEDFELVYLSDYDDEAGAFVVDDKGVRVIARGKDVVRAK